MWFSWKNMQQHAHTHTHTLFFNSVVLWFKTNSSLLLLGSCLWFHLVCFHPGLFDYIVLLGMHVPKSPQSETAGGILIDRLLVDGRLGTVREMHTPLAKSPSAGSTWSTHPVRGIITCASQTWSKSDRSIAAGMWPTSWHPPLRSASGQSVLPVGFLGFNDQTHQQSL